MDGAVAAVLAKPDTAIFLRALGMLGGDAADAVHVGDSVDKDVEGARAAGIAAVLVARGSEAPPDGQVAIRSLAELPSLV